MKQSIRKCLIASVLLLVSTGIYAQSEWENVSSSYFRWGTNRNVKISSSSLTNLSFWNYNAESAENLRNNMWNGEYIMMNINWTESRPWKISFNITNVNNRPDYKYSVIDSYGKEKWHKDNIYWGYEISVKNSSGNSNQ